MSTQLLPATVRQLLRERVAKIAEERDYLHCNRVENAKLIADLTRDPEVGGVIAEYADTARVEKYIKDSLLKKFSDRKAAAGIDVVPLLSKKYKQLREIEFHKPRQAWCFRADGGEIVAVVRTRYPRWEAGLRHLVFYRADLNGKGARIHLALVVCLMGKQVDQAERAHTEKAMQNVGVTVFWHR